jgi:hypothetical protein
MKGGFWEPRLLPLFVCKSLASLKEIFHSCFFPLFCCGGRLTTTTTTEKTACVLQWLVVEMTDGWSRRMCGGVYEHFCGF